MSKKKHPEHVNHERWLVSYADLLTLLFAFFVVLFASSVSDKKKSAKMATAMQTAFQQSGIFDAHAKTPPLADGAGTSQGVPAPIEMPIETPDAPNGVSGGPPDGMRREMEKSLAPAVKQHMITLRNADDGLTLSLDSAGFFPSGSAEVRPAAMPLLAQIAASLPQAPLRVEGHTDNQPIHTAQYRSNWELSTARAAAIAQVLLGDSNVLPANFAIAGYGEFHPIADNGTDAGRAANRRVDIVMIRGRAESVPSSHYTLTYDHTRTGAVAKLTRSIGLPALPPQDRHAR
jgi:chemotaxis protein MotB